MKFKDIVYARKVVRAIQAKNKRENKAKVEKAIVKKKVKPLSNLMVLWLVTLFFIALVLWGALWLIIKVYF